MEKAEVTIINDVGLHARPASQFEELAQSFESDIAIEKNGETFDGKSIVDILYAVIRQGDTITLSATGPDEHEAIQALTALIAGFTD